MKTDAAATESAAVSADDAVENESDAQVSMANSENDELAVDVTASENGEATEQVIDDPSPQESVQSELGEATIPVVEVRDDSGLQARVSEPDVRADGDAADRDSDVDSYGDQGNVTPDARADAESDQTPDSGVPVADASANREQGSDRIYH